MVGNQTRVVVKTRLPPRFVQLNLISCTGRGFPSWASCWIGGSGRIGGKIRLLVLLWRSAYRTGGGNAKNFLREHPEMAAELEAAIRQNAGLVQEKTMDESLSDEDEHPLIRDN